jgi:OmpA-like transmembrane domain.
MKKNHARCASILFCLGIGIVASEPTAAAEPGFYIGGYAGQSSKDAPRSFYELFNDDIQTFAFFTRTEQTASFDDSDIAYGLVMGYRLTPHIAFEGGYQNFGTVTFESRATGNFPLESGTTAVTIESETTGFTLTALGVLPLSRDWELFARAGALFADNKIRISVASQGQRFVPPLGNRFTGSDAQGTTSLYAGLGLSRRFFDIYDLRLEYQRAFDVGVEATGGKADLDTALLGLTVTF